MGNSTRRILIDENPDSSSIRFGKMPKNLMSSDHFRGFAESSRTETHALKLSDRREGLLK
jgi:hypothetical protein